MQKALVFLPEEDLCQYLIQIPLKTDWGLCQIIVQFLRQKPSISRRPMFTERSGRDCFLDGISFRTQGRFTINNLILTILH